jgi:hypothetical protein
MRLAVVACLAACGSYGPLDDVEYREYGSAQAAMQGILDDAGRVRVYAIGEFHPTETVHKPPLAWFASDLLPVLAPHATNLVVETWFDPRCSEPGTESTQAQVEAVTRRPPQQTTDLAGLIAKSKMQTHGLPMTCLEQSAVLDANGRVDFVLLLAMVSDKLLATTQALVAQGRNVIVYGGALHNDLYPRWLLDELAYGHQLVREAPVLELDLVVPEVVFPIKGLWREPWFPLLARSSPERVIVWERGPGSYVMILPAENDVIASRMTDVM